MKNYYVFLLIAFLPFIGNAQIVNIPDAAFKNKLLTYPDPIDLDADGEIQESEAAAVSSLAFSYCNFDNVIGIQSFVNLQTLSFGTYSSVDDPIDLSGMSLLKTLTFSKCSFDTLDVAGLTGLENLSFGYAGHINILNFDDLTSLEALSFYNVHIHSLDLSHSINLKTFSAQNTDLHTLILEGLVNLESFKCTDSDDITSLNIDALTSLKYFELGDTEISTINFSNNILLEEVACGGNDFIALDFSNNINLITLSCYSNDLITLDVSNNINLTSLNCSTNHLTDIDLTNLHKLKQVDVSKNLFTTLDFSSLTDAAEPNLIYYINDNPNLTSVNIKNGKEDLVWTRSDLYCSNLAFMCLDEIDMPAQQALFELDQITNIQINPYCSFVPGGHYNTITGTFTLDGDNNGCDDNDYKFSNGKLSIAYTNQNDSTYTNANGNYSFYTQAGDFIIAPEIENPYFTVSPAAITLNFADSNNNMQVQNFCITPIGVHHDVEIAIIPTLHPKPGADAKYRLVYKNKGNQTLSGNMSFTYDDTILDFVAANPDVDSQSLNELHWSYSNLLPFESRIIDFSLNVNAPEETPAVNNGDVLSFNAAIDPISDDETTADNTFALSQTVSSASDSNDKTCLEGSEVTADIIGNYLHYLIRFSNSGTATADNIVVKDMIDTDKFDMGSLQLISTSHAQVTKITGNKIEFQFEHINLPSESDNEPACHGYVAFKIKTKNNLAAGDSMSNKAEIYFDYNFPIETNTATSTIALLGVNSFENTAITMAPNPVKNKLHISSKSMITAVQLFDVQGRILETMTANQEEVDFDLSRKTAGIYFVKVTAANGVKVEKIIKE